MHVSETVPDPEFRQTNYQRVNAVHAQDCPICTSAMNPSKAWWWTWHGATCTEQCAKVLVQIHHPQGGRCTEKECRRA
jgi:hypothetical protein